MSSTISVAVIWDVENAKVPNNEGGNSHLINPADTIQSVLEANLGDVNIDSFVVCGKMEQDSVSRDQRVHIYWGGADLVDVPIPAENAADIELMIQMAKYARVNPPPAYLILITGDGDMFQALEALTQRGYTTVLAYPENVCDKLLHCADYNVPWKSLYSGSLNGLTQVRRSYPPQLQPCQGIQLKVCFNRMSERTFETYVFWDAQSCRRPANLKHDEVLHLIDEEVQRGVPSSRNDFINITVYGDRYTLPPLRERYTSVKYRTTSHEKHNSLANSLLVDLLKVSMNHKAPANIVIITADRGFNRVARFLKRLRFRVFVVTTGKAKLLQRSAHLLFTWPPEPEVRNVRRRM